MQRFRVAEESMLPALAPGDELVVTDSRAAQPGDIICLPHPNRDDFWLVKRLDHTDGDLAWVASDNLDARAADSRAFGAVPMADLRPRVEHLDDITFREAIELLAAEDEALAAVVGDHGVPKFWQRRPGFPTLVLLIIEQQVSLESGAAVYRRLAEHLGDVTPASVIAAGTDALRRIGVTRQKSEYLTDLAGLIGSGDLDLEGVGGDGAENARTALMAIRGIGAWTADAYLLSALRFPDMFPVGDRALQVGTREVLGLGHDPTEDELDILSAPWRPVRAAAARLIWHAYLVSRGRSEPDDLTA